MGILAENLNWMRDSLQAKQRWGAGTKMVELGDQWLYIHEPPYPGYPPEFLNPTLAAAVLAQGYFKKEGFEHVSLDINGNATTIEFNLDVQQDLSEIPCPDVITDFGTTEHVHSLYNAFKNLHRMPRGRNCVRYHLNPKINNWPDHGNWYRTLEFYPALCEACGYTLLDNYETYALGNTTTGWNIGASLVHHTNNDFISPEQWAELPGLSRGPHLLPDTLVPNEHA